MSSQIRPGNKTLTHWDKERLKKQIMQEKLIEERDWIKQKVQPLEIGSRKEREDAISAGKMTFRAGKEIIELPLVTGKMGPGSSQSALQGVYNVPGIGFVSLRSEPGEGQGPDQLKLLRVEKAKRQNTVSAPENKTGTDSVQWVEKDISGPMQENSFFYRTDDLAHLSVSDDLYREHGLAIKGLTMTEKEQRARHGGRHTFVGLRTFEGLFRKLGYTVAETEKTNQWVNLQGGFAGELDEQFVEYDKKGKHQPFDDMSKYHRIEAIDPKTGKTRIFTFAIDEPKEVKPARDIAKARDR